jgi:hypothetical protein
MGYDFDQPRFHMLPPSGILTLASHIFEHRWFDAEHFISNSPIILLLLHPSHLSTSAFIAHRR